MLRSFVAVLGGLTALIVTSACKVERASVGQACTFNDDCADPLVCAARVCRAPCRTDRDCTGAWRCRASGYVGKRVCLPPDLRPLPCVYSSDCDSPDVCARDGLCRQQCKADYDCQLYSLRARCIVDRGYCDNHPVVVDVDAATDVASDDVRDAGSDVDSGDLGDAGGGDLGDVAAGDAGGDLGVEGGADAGGDATDASTDTPGDRAADGGSDGGADAGAGCGPRRNGIACVPGEAGCDVVSVATGSQHLVGKTCVLQSDGWVRCWGWGGTGTLGSGFVGSCEYPGLVQAINDATELVSGQEMVCARRPSGVWCWGSGNEYGQLGLGTTGGGTPFFASPVMTRVPPGVLSLGTQSGCSRQTDGTALCWGYNIYGQLGDGTTTPAPTPVRTQATGIRSIDLGSGHGCAVLSTGAVSCWGRDTAGAAGQSPTLRDYPNPMPVAGLTGVDQVVAGDNHTCALLTDGTMRCWGINTYGQLGNGRVTAAGVATPTPQIVPLSNVVEIACGDRGTCARLRDGTVWCWGTALAVGNGTSTGNVATPTMVSGVTGARGIAAGSSYCTVLAMGRVLCWGGYAGDGTLTYRTRPTDVVF